MLFVQFQLGSEHYAINAAEVVQVLPLVAITPITSAVRGVAGLFNLHGRPIPLLDLSELVLGRPAERRLSTRVILVRYCDTGGNERVFGLIAEKATQTLRRARAEFTFASVRGNAAPALGAMAPCVNGFVHWIDLHTVLPTAGCESLFGQQEACA